jgi:hypothetical protein
VIGRAEAARISQRGSRRQPAGVNHRKADVLSHEVEDVASIDLATRLAQGWSPPESLEE